MRFFVGLFLAVGIFFSLCFFAQAAALGESDGIALESTRVIYPGSAKNGITFTVTNRTGQTYLLQSRVVPWESTAEEVTEASVAAPFIVIPPLVRFASDEALSLRIRLTKNDLPTDRESVFGLSLNAIPSQSAPSNSSAESGAKMVLALQNNLKLFYRPQGLVVMDENARARALQFTREGAQLRVQNPTPYHVTLGEIRLGAEVVVLGNQRMLKPLSTTLFDHTVTQPTQLSWQIIDDMGRHTPRETRLLN